MDVHCVDIDATGATMFMLISEKFTRLFLNTVGIRNLTWVARGLEPPGPVYQGGVTGVLVPLTAGA